MAPKTKQTRRFIAVRLTDDELAMLREVSARLHTRSIDLATAAVRFCLDPKNENRVKAYLVERPT